jgi:death on curing protein
MIKYLSVRQIIIFHDDLIKKFGGLLDLRDINLLISALEAPKTSFGGKEIYPSIYEKSAVYLYHITKNHPFNDGNKRTAFVASLVFLKANGSPIIFQAKDLEQIVIEVANGYFSKEKLIAFFLNRNHP